MKLHKSIKSLLALAAVAAFASPALAASQTANVEVTATVQNSCTLSAENIAFGVVPMPSNGVATASGNLNVACTTALPYNVFIGAGQPASATHKLTHTNGSTKITYGLYVDGAYTVPAQNGTIPAFTDIGVGSVKTHTLRARMDLNQPALAGNYSNTHVATIEY